MPLFSNAEDRLASLGHTITEVDLGPFLQAAQLLYGGPWVAERLGAVGQFVKEHADAVHPVVRDIILGGEKYSAVDTFNAQYKLEKLRQECLSVWSGVDLLALPTAPNIFRIADVERDPVELNSRLGIFTNFLNLLDLAGIAVPAGFRADGLPFGITFVGQAFSDRSLLSGPLLAQLSFPTPDRRLPQKKTIPPAP
jgi:allophanate hydrolase